MRSQSFINFVFLLIISFFLIHSQSNAQWSAVSYYKLIKEASDIMIIKVNRIEGEEYGKKAIAKIEKSFKKTIQSDSIALPFVYKSWPTGENSYQSVSETMPVSFEVGKRYIVFLVKWHRNNHNPHAAETEYEVINYPKRTFFKIEEDNDPRILHIEQLLKIADQKESEARIDSFFSLIHSKYKEARIDAIEALYELKIEKAAEVFMLILRDDPDQEVRSSAALGLGYLHSDSIANTLLECLIKEKSENVKYEIISSLGMLRVKKAAPELLGLYETEGYNIRNTILSTVSRLRDSTVVPTLLHLFLIDRDRQHQRLMAEIIASFHTPQADEFSSALLDTTRNYYLKGAVMSGWAQSDYTKGFNQIVKLTFNQDLYIENPSKSKGDLQGLMFPLLYAIEKLGSPDQIASVLKVFSNYSDAAIREHAVRLLKKQLTKDINTKLREEIEAEIKSFPSP